MQPLLNIAVNAARQAGDIITRHADQLDRIQITEKSPHDYFSEVDVKAEQMIIQTIHKAYPDHGIIAEESGLSQSDAECVWIIDPLDGTSNYLHGFPFYAVSIAVQIKNRIEHAVVYDPVRHECFAATRGRGARLNDRRLRVSKQTQLSAAMLGAGLQNKRGTHQPAFSTIQSLFDQCASVRRTGSVALELAYVASGRLDGFFGFGLQSWDIAAGCLLIQESGGLISDHEGGDHYLKHGNAIAGTPKVFKSLMQLLHPSNQPST
jgi:myo-inositol-1(or 4)-monophosphatase